MSNDPNLWALGIDPVMKQPTSAHLIVATLKPGEYHEVRVCACGRDYTRTSHPEGWWGSRSGQLPLPRFAIQCGADIVAEQPHDLDC